jgi:conjugative transfer signal peptidase TraF
MFNDTPSIPTGLYRIVHPDEPLHTGDIISFCLPKKAAEYSYQSGYISTGTCYGKYQQIAKMIIAVPGDKVVLTDNSITVYHNNSSIPISYNTPTHVKGKNGYAKRFIKNGVYHTTGYWVYGYYDYLYSYDSRYYGAIPIDSIRHTLKPFLLF